MAAFVYMAAFVGSRSGEVVSLPELPLPDGCIVRLMGEVTRSLWQVSDTELVTSLVDLEIQARQHHAAMLGLLSELDSRCVADKLGYSNTTALLMHTLRISRSDADQRLAQAADLHDVTTPTGAVVEALMPLSAAALARGALGVGHVEAIAKLLGTMKHLEPEKLALAEELMVARAAEDEPAALARYGARWVRDLVDPDGTPPVDDEPRRPERELRRHVRRDGRMELKAWLDAETGAGLEALLAPFEQRRDAADDRGHAERAGDAFAEVLQLAANCPDLPTHNGMKTEIAITVALETLQKAVDETVLPGETRLTVRDARRIACDAHVLPAVLGGESQPLDVAVPAYVVPAHIRRGLVLRDRGCAFPSCDRPASVCHSHHIRSWLKGGPTQLNNLVLLCGQHHRLIHRSAWAVELVGNIAYFTPPGYVDPERKPRWNGLTRTGNSSTESPGWEDKHPA
ncbi:MAG: DUF222 domain-containing protein [Kibdelosporangium sp.]